MYACLKRSNVLDKAWKVDINFLKLRLRFCHSGMVYTDIYRISSNGASALQRVITDVISCQQCYRNMTLISNGNGKFGI